jgi:hypothetical protein
MYVGVMGSGVAKSCIHPRPCLVTTIVKMAVNLEVTAFRYLRGAEPAPENASTQKRGRYGRKS